MPEAPARRFGSMLSALLGLVVFAAIAGVLVAVTVTPAVAVTGIAAKNGLGFFENLPSDLTITPLEQRTQIYAKSHGKDVRIATFYTQNRVIVEWGDVAQTVKNAAVAGEDVRFYQHGGIDPAGIARAVVADLLGKNIQGASTITQQYVKNVCVMEAERLPTRAKVDAAYQVCVDPSLGRKMREMRYAIGLEKKYSKNEILLGYLNIAGFGGQTYGIEAAARYYFDTSAKDLTPAQAASLLAIVNNPERLRLDVPGNLAANTARRNYILRTEYKHRMLSPTEFRTAVDSATKVKLTPTTSGCSTAGDAGFFCDYVVRVIEQDKAFGKTSGDRSAALQSAGWKVYTTLNLDLQKSAQKTMNTYVPKTSKLLDIGGAGVSVEVGTGRIVTMVQNKTYNAGDAGPAYSAVNYNTDEAYGGSGGIQPGSTYKLFTLLDWLKTGHTLYAQVNSDERTIPADRFLLCGKPDDQDAPWPVGNDEGKSENGSWSVYDATRKSINGAFATMGEQLDLCDIRKTAESFDVHPAVGGRLSANPSSIIGTNFVSPLSMATAYAGIANGGRTCTPIAIDRVVKADGTNLAVPKSACRQSVDQQVANAAVYALRSVVTGGTAYGDQTADGIYTFGKTGTTDNAESTWMIGSTSKVTTAVWVGNVQGHVNLRQIHSFPYCPTTYSTQAATMRHCVWKGIQTAVNTVYGGAKSWPAPEQRYLSGGSAPAPTATSSPSSSTGAGVVPQVAGLSKQAAIRALLGASLAWAIGPAVPSTLPAGQIVRTSPAAGTQLSPHTEVTIYPSAG